MIIFDTETTGLTQPAAAGVAAQPRIIDFAAIQLDPWTGEEVNRIEFLLQPDCPLDADITRITGYRDADLASAPRFPEVLPGLINFFLGETCMLAHNLQFDRDVLFWELTRMGAVTLFPWPPLQLCSMQMNEERFGKWPKLTALYEAVLGRKLDQKHTAMADVEALVEIVLAERLYELGRPG